MSRIEVAEETDQGEDSLEREVSVSRYPGCDPVTVRTTHLDGEEPSREEQTRSGLRRMAQEGPISAPRG